MNIKVEQFEGPLGLLLKLIEKEEMDITQISLGKIADEYVNFIRTSEKINPEEMADFLVVASKLLLIKSKALLPYLYPEEEEEIEELEQQLKMYKEFLEAMKVVEKMIGKKKFMFAREFNRKAILNATKLFSPPKKLRADDMKNVLDELIERIRPIEQKLEEKIMEKKINIEDKIFNIQKMLIDRIKMSFKQVLENAENKTEVIVSFLAMLELIKQREIVADQGELFTDIMISKKE
jgi:segregation and condensation protein A